MFNEKYTKNNYINILYIFIILLIISSLAFLVVSKQHKNRLSFVPIVTNCNFAEVVYYCTTLEIVE